VDTGDSSFRGGAPHEASWGGEQTWRTFVRNHGKELWVCDLLTQYTALFAVAHVLVIMEIDSRRIVHVNVTTNPSLLWVKQQIREGTPWDTCPRFLVHDNDGIFGQYGTRATVERDGKRRSYRCHLDRWLDEIMGIGGLQLRPAGWRLCLSWVESSTIIDSWPEATAPAGPRSSSAPAPLRPGA
jgi:hypothetical protein